MQNNKLQYNLMSIKEVLSPWIVKQLRGLLLMKFSCMQIYLSYYFILFYLVMQLFKLNSYFLFFVTYMLANDLCM